MVFVYFMNFMRILLKQKPKIIVALLILFAFFETFFIYIRNN